MSEHLCLFYSPRRPCENPTCVFNRKGACRLNGVITKPKPMDSDANPWRQPMAVDSGVKR